MLCARESVSDALTDKLTSLSSSDLNAAASTWQTPRLPYSPDGLSCKRKQTLSKTPTVKNGLAKLRPFCSQPTIGGVSMQHSQVTLQRYLSTTHSLWFSGSGAPCHSSCLAVLCVWSTTTLHRWAAALHANQTEPCSML